MVSDIRPRLPRMFLAALHAYAAVGFPDDSGELLLATENVQPGIGEKTTARQGEDDGSVESSTLAHNARHRTRR